MLLLIVLQSEGTLGHWDSGKKEKRKEQSTRQVKTIKYSTMDKNRIEEKIK
jgi:hypothetical protein